MPVKIALDNEPTVKRILLGYYAAFFLLLVSFLITFYTNSKLNSHVIGVEKTDKKVRNIQMLFAEVKNAESAHRGYLIIHDESFLEPYRAGFVRVDSIMRELSSSIEGEVQRSQIDSISLLLKRQYRVFEEGLAAFHSFAAGDTVVRLLMKGKMLTDDLEKQLKAIEMTERAALADRTEQLDMYSKAVLPVNLFTGILAILLAVYAMVTYKREKRIAEAADKERRQKGEQLEQKVRELRVANEELVKLRRIEKFAATGRMSRILAHEVRNPLSNINLATSQLKDEPLAKDENAAMLLDLIMRNSDRINQLMTELLNATRIQDMKFAKVSVNELLDETLTAASDRAQLQNIQIIKEYAGQLSDISADRDKLKIAFLNLIVNAIEAMKAGEGVLRLRTETRNGRCVVTISDNGVGIDQESLGKLFEPYFTSKSRGSGLGLANTQAIILTHKGNIEVESEPGKGATFVVTLELWESS